MQILQRHHCCFWILNSKYFNNGTFSYLLSWRDISPKNELFSAFYFQLQKVNKDIIKVVYIIWIFIYWNEYILGLILVFWRGRNHFIWWKDLVGFYSGLSKHACIMHIKYDKQKQNQWGCSSQQAQMFVFVVFSCLNLNQKIVEKQNYIYRRNTF